jgi:SAM-dependent methyltransferase
MPGVLISETARRHRWGAKMPAVADSYYSSGQMLRAKNELAGGRAVDVPAFALAHVPLERVRIALDVGCGWGRFARPLALETAVDLTCLDVWPGMVESCRQTLAEAGVSARFVVADARAIPVRDGIAGLVMANHMLYQFAGDDLERVVAELARVTAVDGVLLATTYSDAESVPMTDLHNETLAALGFPDPGPQPSSFSLENGGDVLGRGFSTVEVHVLEEVTKTDDADAFTSLYLKTGGYHWAANHDGVSGADRAAIESTFRTKARARVDEDGAITTRTTWTAFVATGPRWR